jgi:hypothetical protein
LFQWQASSGNWCWQGTYPADVDPEVIVIRALLSLRGLGASTDRVTVQPKRCKSGYLMHRTINLVTPDKRTASIETAFALEAAENLERQALAELRKRHLLDKITKAAKDFQLGI